MFVNKIQCHTPTVYLQSISDYALITTIDPMKYIPTRFDSIILFTLEFLSFSHKLPFILSLPLFLSLSNICKFTVLFIIFILLENTYTTFTYTHIHTSCQILSAKGFFRINLTETELI